MSSGGVEITEKGRLFLLISAGLIAIDFVFSGVSGSLTYSPPILIVIGLSCVLLVYALRLVLIIQASAIDSVKITRILSRESVEGENIDVIVKVENPTNIAIYNVEVKDNYPKTMKLIDGSNHIILSIPASGSIEIKYTLKTRMIGLHTFGSIDLVLRDYLNLFRYSTSKDVKNDLRIYPRSYEPSHFTSIFPGSKTITGASFTRKKGSGYEFADIREYRPGDDLRRIEWKATARLGKLMIKEFDAEGVATIVIILDATGSMAYGVVGERKIDYAARTIAYLLNYLSKRRDYLGFIFYDGVEHKVIPISSAAHQFPIIYRILGELKVSRSLNKKGLANIIYESIGRIGIREKTLYLLISDLEGDLGALPKVLAELKAMKHEVIIISPLTPLFEAPALEKWEGAIYRVVTVDYWKKRDEVIKQLGKYGIPVIDVGPNDFIPTIIAKIEDYRRMVL